MDEKIMVEQAKSGDKQAFAELYTIYKDKLYRYAFFKLQNEQDATDAVSDCVLEAYRYITSLKNAQAFSGWIFKILYRCCSRKISEQATRRAQTEIPENLSYAEDFYNLELSQALSALTGEERDIVLLSAVAGYTSKEIARLIGSKPNTVRSKLSRSLSKMRELLE